MFLLLLFSCNKSIEVKPPVDQLTTAAVFSDDQTATSAVLGMYSQMFITTPLLTCGGVTLYTGLSADELHTTGVGAEEKQFSENAIQPNNSIILSLLWQRGYRIIYGANACIEGINKSSQITERTKKQLLGEAKTIRAFIYFYLVNLFGEVPLVLSTDYRLNSFLSRTPLSEIYSQMVKDLEEAKELLSGSYPSAGRVRINKWAAVALLSRIYLFQKQWVKAEVTATEVILSNLYGLSADPGKSFLASSPEAIWQLASTLPASFNTAEGFIFNTFSPFIIPGYVVNDSLVNAFEAGDSRKAAWLKSNVVGGKTYSYPFKYKVKFSSTISEIYVMLRYAEQYLIRSEARAHQNNISGAGGDLNIIRRRAGLSDTRATDSSSILHAIEQERRIEFIAEWGHRWLDLKRTGRINSVLGKVKPGWQATDALFPIPLTELLSNPSLKQNEGY